MTIKLLAGLIVRPGISSARTSPRALHAVLVNTKTKSINRVACPIAKPDFRLIVLRQPALPVSLVNTKMKINKPGARIVHLGNTKMKPNNASAVKHAVLAITLEPVGIVIAWFVN